MAISAVVYNAFKQKLLSQANAIDFDADAIKVALLTSSYTPNYDTHDFFDDITNELSTGSGYTAGGATLASPTVNLDTGGDFAYFDADDTTWTSLTATFRYAVVYKSTGTAGTSPLIGLIDFGVNQTPAGINYVIQWATPASGAVLKVA